MQCESCNTEFMGDTCPNCGLKQIKVACGDCHKKFYKSYLKNGLCPECFENELSAPYKSPYTALLLSVIPGLGHYYLGQRDKGAAYFLIFCMSFLLPIFLPLTYFCPAFGAFLTAKRMNRIDEVITHG